MGSDDDFDDFVSYTPLSRKRASSPSSQKKSITLGHLLKKSPPKIKKGTSQGNVCNGRNLKSDSSLNLNKRPTKPAVKRRTTDSVNLHSKIKKEEDDDRCPSCQMPWTCYKATGKSFNLHIDECLDINLHVLPECKDGATCKEVVQDHFWKFSHFLLANVRDCGNNSENRCYPLNKFEPEVVLKIKSEVEDLDFGNAVNEDHMPGPSGWKSQRVEAVNSDEALSESCSTVMFGAVDMSRVEHFDMETTINGPAEIIEGNDSNVTEAGLSLPHSNAKGYEKRRTNFTTECGPRNMTVVNIHNEESVCGKENAEEYGARNCVTTAGIHNEEDVSGKEDAENRDKCASPGILIDSDDELFGTLVDQALDKYLNKCEESKQANHINVNETGKNPSVSPQNPNQNKTCRSSSHDKKCVHIHLHISPGKTKNRPSKQPSIIDFLLPKKKPLSANEVTAEPPVSPGTSEKGDLRGPQAWNSLMNRMRQKGYSMQGVTQSQTSTNSQLSEQGSKNSQNGKESGWQQRKCPFYKFIPDTNFVVDAFCYGYQDGITGYFLTHFHYDHFRGLTKSFRRPVYCNRITGNLVRERIKLPDKYLHILPMEEPAVICGVEVTLLEANHCPGAAMILFKLVSGRTILHVGDFRAHSKMESYPALWNDPVHTLYLDTTYCNPTYSFPSQEEVIEKCVLIAMDHNQQNPKSLIAVGSYTIGKERVFKAIAEALDCKIWVSADKHRTLRCIEDQEILDRITSVKLQAKIHVLPMKEMNPRSLHCYIETLKPQYDTLVGIKPTGWEHANNVSENLDDIEPYNQGSVFLYGIPYSEHSSYEELKRFVQFVQPKRIIPTVNVGNPQVRKKMEADFQKWMKESPFSKFGIAGCFQQVKMKTQNTRQST